MVSVTIQAGWDQPCPPELNTHQKLLLAQQLLFTFSKHLLTRKDDCHCNNNLEERFQLRVHTHNLLS